MYFYKIQTEGDTQKWGSQCDTEAIETGVISTQVLVMKPQGKKQSPNPGRNWKRQETDSPLETTDGAWSRTIKERISIVITHQVCGNLLRRTRKPT